MKHLSSISRRTLVGLLLLIVIAMPLWIANVSSQGPKEAVESAEEAVGSAEEAVGSTEEAVGSAEEAVGSAEEESAAAPSAPSTTIFSYQGQLLDGNGDPITNAAMPMTFHLYTAATGGTACWTENHTSGNAVNVSDGLFHVSLGQITAINSACLTNDAYLELVVNGETLSPRELLTSVAHAIEAGTLTSGATARGDFGVDGQITVNGTGQSIINHPQDVTNSGNAALRFGSGATWLGIDNNEIASFGGPLRLQQSSATTDVIIGTSLKVEQDAQIDGNLTVEGELSPKKVSLDHGTMCVSGSPTMNVNEDYETAFYPEVLTMTLEVGNTVLIWIDGLAKFTGMACGTESAVGVFLDNSGLIWEMNYCADRWFNMNGMRIKQLSAGTYDLKIAAMAAEAGTLELHSGGGNQTCINYLILGQ